MFRHSRAGTCAQLAQGARGAHDRPVARTTGPTALAPNLAHTHAVELRETADAKQRQQDAGERGREGGRGKKKTLGAPCPKGNAEDGRAKDKAAKAAGYGRRAMEMVDAIKKSADARRKGSPNVDTPVFSLLGISSTGSIHDQCRAGRFIADTMSGMETVSMLRALGDQR